MHRSEAVLQDKRKILERHRHPYEFNREYEAIRCDFTNVTAASTSFRLGPCIIDIYDGHPGFEGS